MAHLTGNFTYETPLSKSVREAISAALEQGWADPKKQSQAAGRAAILAESAKSEIAAHLSTAPERLEVVGEPNLVHFLALAGFIHGTNSLFTSTSDVGKIRALSRSYGDESQVIGIDDNGILLTKGLKFPKGAVVSIQATNGETGAMQNLDLWRGHSSHIVIDGTRSTPDESLIQGFAATTFDATSWNGPHGIGFIAINDEKNFKYPLPHTAPIRAPGSFSLPLLVGSAIALTEFRASAKHLTSLRALLIEHLKKIDGVTVLAQSSGAGSRYLSILIDEISSEEVLRSLLRRDLSIDAGSACSPDDLAPSHVIASMGYPTTGHLRFTLHPHHNEADIASLTQSLKEVLQELRS